MPKQLASFVQNVDRMFTELDAAYKQARNARNGYLQWLLTIERGERPGTAIPKTEAIVEVGRARDKMDKLRTEVENLYVPDDGRARWIHKHLRDAIVGHWGYCILLPDLIEGMEQGQCEDRGVDETIASAGMSEEFARLVLLELKEQYR